MEQVQTTVAGHPEMPGFVSGRQPAVLALNSMAAELAFTDIPVLIHGESGAGKDVYARLINYLSPQRNFQLQKINCSASNPADFINGANELALTFSNQAGTPGVYLDNIQELDLAGQRALLSHINETECMGARYASAARLISSTTRNLEPEVASGRFLHELYFRLNGATLRLPPLRERAEDIPVLMDYFLTKHAEIMKRTPPCLDNKVIQVMMDYQWPGNIRELESFARRIVVFGDVQMATDELRSLSLGGTIPAPVAEGTPLRIAARAASKQTERQLILQALERTHWNRKRAARDLKISYKALLYKIKQIGLSTSGNAL